MRYNYWFYNNIKTNSSVYFYHKYHKDGVQGQYNYLKFNEQSRQTLEMDWVRINRMMSSQLQLMLVFTIIN